MIDRKCLQDALLKLGDPETPFSLTARKGDPGWQLKIDNIDTAVLNEERKDWILQPGLKYASADPTQQAEMIAQMRERAKTAIRYLLVMPSVPDNLDAATAESIMGWYKEDNTPSCGCFTYRTANGGTRLVPSNPAIGCSFHEIWSPTTNLAATQDLLEKPFLCIDGRNLAIESYKFDGTAEKPNEDHEITNQNIKSCRSEITFRNTARTDTFMVTYERLIPPAAVCLAALKEIGIVDIRNHTPAPQQDT